MPRPLALIGGGGHCRSVIDAALSAGFTVTHIVGPAGAPPACVIGPYCINATDDDIPALAADHDFVISVGAIGRADLRRRIAETVKRAGGHFATVVASTAWVSPFASIGEGTVVLHHATVNAGARVGVCGIVNTSATVEHDASVGDFCHISTGARINGAASVGHDTTVGSNAVILQCVSVPPRCLIGAGCVVTGSLSYPGTYVGAPARLIKLLDNDLHPSHCQ